MPYTPLFTVKTLVLALTPGPAFSRKALLNTRPSRASFGFIASNSRIVGVTSTLLDGVSTEMPRLKSAPQRISVECTVGGLRPPLPLLLAKLVPPTPHGQLSFSGDLFHACTQTLAKWLARPLVTRRNSFFNYRQCFFYNDDGLFPRMRLN
jgi:hypothetical protein